MELKYDKDTNVCEYFNEKNSSIIHVLSNDEGLWFNLNDSFKLFGMIKSSKIWFSKNLKPNEKRWVEFYRMNRKSKELFIPEQKMHELISKIQDDFNDNVDFIYGIIADYDMTCINIKDMELNVEERIALHALKAESVNFVERTEKYLDVLKGKTVISDYFKDFEHEIDDELKASETKYNNEKCPEDLRQEKIKEENEMKSKNNFKDIKEIGESLDNMLNDIESFIDVIDTTYHTIELLENIDNNEMLLLYDDIVVDSKDIINTHEHVKESMNEKIKRNELITNTINKLEGKTKESTCPKWLTNIIK